MKQCTRCKQIKDISEFGKNKNGKNGLRSYCKECQAVLNKMYRHSKDGVIASIYSHQRNSSKRRKHPIPTYSKQELKDWLFSQKKFHLLYDNWKRLDFQSMYKPSVDRIDDSIGYTMANIQLMIWGENNAKSHKDMRSGKLKHGHNPQKAVLQYSKNGEFVAEFVSVSQAKRETGIPQTNISKCCNGKLKHAGGYIWKFKEAI